MLDISIVIVNYNSGNYLKKCIDSIIKNNLDKSKYEVIVVDNASDDNSANLKFKNSNIKIYKRDLNDGFSAGNNYGLSKTNPKTKYIFFLNPDTLLYPNTLQKLIKTFKSDKGIDAISPCILLKKTGKLQPECHRGFPTPLRSFLHFTGLSSKGYFQTNLDTNTIHQVEAGVGAALVLKRKVGDKLAWWDTDYFMYGEDLQLCWDLKQNNFNLYFVPEVKLVHFQGISSGVKKHTASSANKQTRTRSIVAGTRAMQLFYKKNLAKNYPSFFNKLIYFSINILEKKRLSKLIA